jgi:hypothetical protein
MASDTPSGHEMKDLCLDVVREAYLTGGFKVQSNFARAAATTVGLAASLHLITTLMPGGSAGDVWRVTSLGLSLLEQANA